MFVCSIVITTTGWDIKSQKYSSIPYCAMQKAQMCRIGLYTYLHRCSQSLSSCCGFKHSFFSLFISIYITAPVFSSSHLFNAENLVSIPPTVFTNLTSIETMWVHVTHVWFNVKSAIPVVGFYKQEDCAGAWPSRFFSLDSRSPKYLFSSPTSRNYGKHINAR